MCDQCEALMINGVGCHEQGCPNGWTDPATGIGRPRECKWCGSEFIPESSDQEFCDNNCDCYYHNVPTEKEFKEGIYSLPSINELADELYEYGQDLVDDYVPYELPQDDDDIPYGDVRLQVHDGDWTLHTGDSSFDQDHRGAWGSASVSAGEDLDTCQSIASDLIDEAYEDMEYED